MKPTFKNLDEAINTIIESSQQHSHAIETGDYKTANKNYELIQKAVIYLRQNDGIEKLTGLLTYNDIGVKVVAASYLLKHVENQAVTVLEEIESKSIPHHSFTAELVLQEWRKGKLNL